MKCKSYKERQVKLNELIDQLSFDYPDVYSLFSREMKRREIESNDTNKMSTWLNVPNSYEKLHESLILVKSTNLIAIDEYLDCLKRMLLETIENGTNIDKTVKICRLIEKSAHLASIYDQLKYLIQRVYQIDYNKAYSMKRQLKSVRPDKVNQFRVDPLQLLNIQCNQPLHIPVWPTTLQPCYDKPYNSFPNLNLDFFGNRRHTFDFQSSLSNITIVDQGMNGAFAKWLHYLKLHKYQWFFNGLSYLEIECIDEFNIEAFITKVNKSTITKGAQKKICLSIKLLRDREKKMADILMSLDLDVTLNELCEYITYMQDILHYPIPNKHCIAGDQLQKTIACVMEKLFTQLLEKLDSEKLYVSHSLIGTSINKFLECILLIQDTQTFSKEQVDKSSDFAKSLKYHVRRMPKN